MALPFQYDNFVQSQIGIGNDNNIQYGSRIYKNENKNTTKQKINQLLGLCKNQNDSIKNEFKQVIGAQKQILQLIKQDINQSSNFNQYTRSNVQMFPNHNPIISGAPALSQYGQENKSRNYQTFPVNASRNYYGNQSYQPQSYQQQPYQPQTYQSQTYQPQNYQPQNYQPQSYQPQSYQPQNQSYQHQHPQTYQSQTYQPHQQATNYQQNQPYQSDFQGTNQNIPTSSYGYPQGYNPNDRANILKSKNNRLKNINQPNLPRQDDDYQIRQLQQQVNRLKNIVQDYQNQIAALNNNNAGTSDKANLLRQLKDQGERIRQDTISLLKGKANSGYVDGTENQRYNQGYGGGYNANQGYGGGYNTNQGYSGGYNPNQGYSEGFNQNQGNSGGYNQNKGYSSGFNQNQGGGYNANQGYGGGNYGYQQGAPEFVPTNQRDLSGLTAEQQALFRAQLNDLRAQCEQLQQQNAHLKRTNRGVSASRRF